MINIDVEVEDQIFKSFRRKIEGELQKAVDSATLLFEGEAKINSPVDTGTLRNSIFSVTSKTDGGAIAYSAALQSNPQASLFDYQPQEKKPLVNYVHASVKYARDQEYGSQGRKGRFMFHRAGETIKPLFVDLVKKAIRDAGGKA